MLRKRSAVYWQLGQQGLGAEILSAAYMAAWAASQGRGFYLDSSKWNFFYRRGWQDYFRPVFPEISLARWLGIIDINKPNQMKARMQKAILIIISAGKLFSPVNTFWKIWNRDTSQITVDAFKLFDREYNSLEDAASDVVRAAWVPWEGICQEASRLYPLPNYKFDVGAFLRGGDKEGEIPQPDLKKVSKVFRSNKKNVETVFLATDDYKKFQTFKNTIPAKKVSTLCPKESHGHFQQNFNRLLSAQRRAEMLRYLKILEILCRSETFIGPYSSNFARLAYILRNGKNSRTTDFGFTVPTPFS